jgi:amino acid transporter
MSTHDDHRLDAGRLDDAAYLESLGYRQELRRVLGLFSSFSIQFTGIAVAGGVFLTFGYGIATIGPALLIAWLIAGGLQMVVALSTAEAVSAYPLAGGAYQIINRLASVRLGWQVGWWLLMAHLAALAAEAIGLAPFVADWAGSSELSHNETLLVGFGLLVICTVINIVGVRIAALVNNAGVVAELTAVVVVVVALLVVLVAGSHDFQGPDYFFKDAGVVPGGGFVLLPFLYAMLVPAFVISGFDVSGTAGEETTEAARTVPRGLMIANISAFVAGTAIIGLVLLAVTNLDGAVADGAPMTFILSAAIGSFLAKFFEVLAVLSLLVNMVVLQLTAARILWSQARDGQMPLAKQLTRLNGNRIPVTTTLLAAVVAMGFAIWSSLLTVLIAMTAVLWAAGYAVLVGVTHVAKRDGRLPDRPWKNRHWKAIDGVAFIWSIALCVILIRQDWQKVGLGFLGVVVIGALIYYLLIPADRRGRVPGVSPDGSPRDDVRPATAPALEGADA